MSQLPLVFERAARARASRAVEVPEWMGRILWVRSRGELMKGAGHKYIRRVAAKNPPPKWRYYYSAGGGAGLGHADEITTGAAFKLSHGGQAGHFHVTAELDGDLVRVRHDETGHEVEITRAALAAMLHREHAALVSGHAAKVKEDLEAVKKHGTAAQRARVESRARRYQHTRHLAEDAGVGVRPYVSPRERELTPAEAEVRRVAYAIKRAHETPEDTRTAARAMAQAVPALAQLVPIPSSKGDTRANAALCEQIAGMVHGASVADVLHRLAPTEPSHQRRKRGLAGHTADAHRFEVTGELDAARPVIFVDNVTTSGATFEAAGRDVGRGTGVAYAKATSDNPAAPAPTAWRSGADGHGGAGLRILSLFSGAGGFDMGLHAGLPHARTTGLCEIDPYARKVLARAFPGVAQHEDVNTLASGEDKPAERPNMIIGGFPCQDLSAANVRAKGLSGERSGLYRKMRDIIEGQDPDWVVFENVPLLRSRGLDVVLMDMQALGYEVTWDSISGASVGAPHQRDRVFVVCHRPGVKLDWQRPDRELTGHHWQSDPPPLRDSGTHRQTRIAHTVLAGNAVIPQVAEHLGEIIGGSSPGQAEPTGKEIARWTGDAWVSPKGKPVVKFPRAGLLRDGVVYENEHTKQDGGGIREGDKVWVRNTDSAGGGDVYDAEQRLALDHLTRNTTIPPAMQTTVDELVSWGIVDKTDKGYTLTGWGEHAVENMSQWTYDGEGGVNDAFLGRVHYVNGDSYDVELPNGDIEPFDEEYVRLMPTVVKSDWKGYGKADSENTPQYDTGRAGRDRGRQLMHWVDGYINPKFAEWHMGFPRGHFDVGQAPDDYKPIK